MRIPRFAPRAVASFLGLTFLALGLATPAQAQCPNFSAATNLAAGTTPLSVAIGDFNGDGKLDLAAVNSGSNDVSMLLGNGSGGFTPAVSPGVGTTPKAVVAGDFNHDGILDLAVANSGSANVSILTGNGNGTFAAAVNLSVGSSPTALAIGDFNGDGNPDLAVANNADNNVSMLLGTGNGTFSTAAGVSAGSAPTSIVVGDFDGNGKADLAIANSGSDNVSILLGSGTGTFPSASIVSAGTTPSWLVVGDFDGNGKQDLAVANRGSGNVSILLGSGSGGFAAATGSPVAAATNPASVTIADFNGDGKTDLAVANSGASNASILIGNGDGTFATALNSNAGSGPASVVSADFNRDGKPDLAVANGNSNNLSILLNIGACYTNCGTFAPASGYGVGTSPSSVATGDFRGNGRRDLAVVNSGSDNISILLANGNGTFAAAVNQAVGTTPKAVVAGDFDRDGKLDLAVANSGSGNVSILLGNGSGGFAAAASPTAGLGPTALATGDFNGDGIPDLAVANNTDNNVSILLGNGNGTFAAAGGSPIAINGPTSIVVGNFDGNGKADIAVTNSGPNGVSILLGNGNGTFFAAASASIGGSSPKGLAIGDFDGDGKPDLAVGNSLGVSILRGVGNGLFAPSVTYPVDADSNSVVVGDLDGNGRADLVVTNASTLSFRLLLGNGDGTFATPVSYNAGTSPRSTAVGDFNGDGKSDLAVVNSGSANISILLNTCPAPDLTVSKFHAGSFAQGSTGRTYSITVTSIGAAPTSGTVTVTDTLPAGLTATAMTGEGWNCTLNTLTCTRNEALWASSNYPPITLTVDVANNAAPTITNTVTVSGGDQINTANDTASDPTTIDQLPDLTLTKTHSSSFTQGQTGAVYTITVTNPGGAASSGTVTVTEALPAGLTATALSGSGWNCTPLAALTCTRSESLAAGNSYEAITLTVTVANNAGALITNTATVSGGGESNNANDTANDPTTVNQLADLTVTKTHTGNFTQGQTGRTYTITVHNAGAGSTSGTVSVTDTLPTGLTATALSGSGWSCPTLGPLTCTRSDALGAALDYPAITLTVTVANDAPASVTNSVSVSGGGEIITNNDSTTDPTTINPPADVTVTKTHTGDFTQGQMFKTYTIAVTNVGAGPTSGTVTVTDTLPVGLTAASIGGTGWTCAPAILTCTRSDVLAASSPYPAITVTVNVASNAPASVTNTATVSGGSELNTANDMASDSTTVNATGSYCGKFAAAKTFGTFLTPASIAIGDFNRDGKSDLAIVNYVYVSIRLGNGDGTFSAGDNYSAASNITSVASGDFNGDGKVDLVFADVSSTVSVLLGNGNGTFASSNSGLGTIPAFVASGDFNGDGKVDLVVANVGSTVSVLMGNGNGTFGSGTGITVGTSPVSPVAGDFNGDGRLDLAVANYDSDNVSILLGNGNGTFEGKVDYPAGTAPSSVAIGDLNGDGRLDLAITDSGGIFTTSNVSILLGNGNGTFAAKVEYSVGANPTSVAIGDFDGDGKPDLAVTDFNSSGFFASDVSILRGNGDGTFAAAGSYGVGTNPKYLAIGDFNGDGRPDLAVANEGSGDVSILLSACADLAITKSHPGNFTQGQTSASYALTASNAGMVPTSGTVTVTDALPAGLVATAIGGTGWTCSLGTLTCTRSDVLAPGGSYPVITVTVNVNSNAAATVTNSASVSGVGDTNTANNSANDSTTISPSGLMAPTNLVTFAFGASPSPVTLNWNAVTTAVAYRVFRSSGGGSYNLIATVSITAFVDSGVAPGTTYLYQVRAVDGASNVSAPSNIDLATTIVLTDASVAAGFTVIKAVHLTELRTAVNAVRAAAGLAAATFTDPSLSGVVIKAIHLTELRSNLDAARAIIGVPAIVYTDPGLAAGTTARAAHILELRLGVKGFIDT